MSTTDVLAVVRQRQSVGAPSRRDIDYLAVYSQLTKLARLGLVHHKPRFADPLTPTALWSIVCDAESDAAFNAALA